MLQAAGVARQSRTTRLFRPGIQQVERGIALLCRAGQAVYRHGQAAMVAKGNCIVWEGLQQQKRWQAVLH